MQSQVDRQDAIKAMQSLLDASRADNADLEKQLALSGATLNQQLGELAAAYESRLKDLAAAYESRLKDLAAANESLRSQLEFSESRRSQSEDSESASAQIKQQLAEAQKQLAEAQKQLAEAQQQPSNSRLARYRSEFFGKLREVLGNRSDVQIVGDRFIFQSEVLFDPGSAVIGEEGQHQLAAFADTLKNITARIPSNIDWILRVDGHTGKRPYVGGNWQLSTARAIAVVQYLMDQGIPGNRLVAAGYAEFRPLVEGDSDDAYRRNRRIELQLDQR
jgi:chemotaxis protein MotB